MSDGSPDPGPFVLGVDLDGVCGDYTSAFRAVVAAERGVDPASLGPQRTWEFTEWGISSDQFDDFHRKAVLEHRMFLSMDAVPGAAEALWRLSDAGVWVRVITHRLCVNWGHAIAVADTVSWLDRIGLPYRDICFLGRKPEVEAHAYVDDGAHNVLALRALGNDVIVYDQPYNQAIEGPRAHSWEEVESWVAERAARRGTPLQSQFPGLDDPGRRLDRRLNG
jgi:5'(3')-deoxyribonucleotidase